MGWCKVILGDILANLFSELIKHHIHLPLHSDKLLEYTKGRFVRPGEVSVRENLATCRTHSLALPMPGSRSLLGWMTTTGRDRTHPSATRPPRRSPPNWISNVLLRYAYGLRYAAHCFNSVDAQQNGLALIPAEGKLVVTSAADQCTGIPASPCP